MIDKLLYNVIFEFDISDHKSYVSQYLDGINAHNHAQQRHHHDRYCGNKEEYIGF